MSGKADIHGITGNLFISIGILLIVIGAVLNFAPGLVTWFGKLPGDIRIEKDHVRICIPITSMILASILLTILLHLFRRQGSRESGKYHELPGYTRDG